MLKKHYIMLAASAFALSACLGSGDSNGNGGPNGPTDPRNDTPVEGMPTSGSATYSGAISNIRGDGDMTLSGQMSMTANFAQGGGTISDSSLTITGIQGTLTQAGAHAFEGNDYENLPLLGTLTMDGGSIVSGGNNQLLVGGTFSGEGATGVSANLGGSVMTEDGSMPITAGRGDLSQVQSQ